MCENVVFYIVLYLIIYLITRLLVSLREQTEMKNTKAKQSNAYRLNSNHLAVAVMPSVMQ
jgi:Na+/pantothenate symporter